MNFHFTILASLFFLLLASLSFVDSFSSFFLLFPFGLRHYHALFVAALAPVCLICVSTYELASLFSTFFSHFLSPSEYREWAAAVLTERSLEESDFHNELKLWAATNTTRKYLSRAQLSHKRIFHANPTPVAIARKKRVYEKMKNSKCWGNKADDKVESYGSRFNGEPGTNNNNTNSVAATRLYESFTLFSHFDGLSRS